MPYGPSRQHDSGSTQVAAKATISSALGYLDRFDSTCQVGCPLPAAFAVTATAVAPKAAGSLITYAADQPRLPIPTVSLGAGQSVSDSATPTTPTGYELEIYLDSTGSTRIYLDESGYYIPVS